MSVVITCIPSSGMTTVLEDRPIIGFVAIPGGEGDVAISQIPVGGNSFSSPPPEPVYRPTAPKLNIEKSYGSYEYNSNPGIPGRGLPMYFVRSITVYWDEVEFADFYKVYLVDEYASNSTNKTDVFYTEEAREMTNYAGGQIFSEESSFIFAGYTSFSYVFPPSLMWRRVNAFVFAYNRFGRCEFPPTMMSFVAEGRNSHDPINQIYIETTSYSDEQQPPTIINIIKGDVNNGGSVENLDSKIMEKYTEPPPP